MLLNGLLVLVAPNFRTDTRNVKRRTECFSEMFLHVFASSLMMYIHLRAATDRLLCSPPLNKLFSTISDPAFTEANKALEHLQKTAKKQATLPAC